MRVESARAICLTLNNCMLKYQKITMAMGFFILVSIYSSAQDEIRIIFYELANMDLY
jgi:hypothetical protein